MYQTAKNSNFNSKEILKLSLRKSFRVLWIECQLSFRIFLSFKLILNVSISVIKLKLKKHKLEALEE